MNNNSVSQFLHSRVTYLHKYKYRVDDKYER